MKKISLLLVLTLGAFAFQSCENDDPNPENQSVKQAFAAKYPEASGVNWGTKSGYQVAGFANKGIDSEAWFDSKGEWNMTETDIVFNALPDAIKTAFAASVYKTWLVDDVDMLERKSMETIYVIEVEKGGQEHDLYYAADGILIKVDIETNESDDNEHYLPPVVTDGVKTYLATHYAQAKILEMDKDDGMIEVDILDVTTHRELLFTLTGEWVSTKTEVSQSAVPANITDVLKASEYATYAIEDVDYCETPLRNYYYFELELGSREVDLIITLEGKIEIVKISND